MTQFGWAVTPRILSRVDVDELRTEVGQVSVVGRGGARNILELPSVRRLATSPPIRALAEAILGPAAFVVRGLLFDKTPDANWKVIWHQDLTIATLRREPQPGFGPWTEKDGVPHVQPPMPVLESMLAIRVHLDNCGARNGPVRVISGSHQSGRLTPEAIDSLKEGAVAECLVEEGGVLAFRPLILHASSPAAEPGHRRVVHLEFAADELPSPLEWKWHVA